MYASLSPRFLAVADIVWPSATTRLTASSLNQTVYVCWYLLHFWFFQSRVILRRLWTAKFQGKLNVFSSLRKDIFQDKRGRPWKA
jgi:hypothetical protein